MTDVETANIRSTERWLELYNTDVHRLIDDMYTEDAALVLPGFASITGRKALHEGEAYVLSKAPDREARLLRAIAKNDTVIAECVLTGTEARTGEPWETHWCAILTFDEGRIVSDHSYIDVHAWPGVSDILAGMNSDPASAVRP